MKEVYPELETHREFIEKMVSLEEERFRSTLTVGLNKLDELFTSTKGAMPEYKTLARLYDTFGTPRDLIRVGWKSEALRLTRTSSTVVRYGASETAADSGGRKRVKPKPRLIRFTQTLAGRLPNRYSKGMKPRHVTDAKVVAVIKGTKSSR